MSVPRLQLEADHYKERQQLHDSHREHVKGIEERQEVRSLRTALVLAIWVHALDSC